MLLVTDNNNTTHLYYAIYQLYSEAHRENKENRLENITNCVELHLSNGQNTVNKHNIKRGNCFLN